MSHYETVSLNMYVKVVSCNVEKSCSFRLTIWKVIVCRKWWCNLDNPLTLDQFMSLWFPRTDLLTVENRMSTIRNKLIITPFLIKRYVLTIPEGLSQCLLASQRLIVLLKFYLLIDRFQLFVELKCDNGSIDGNKVVIFKRFFLKKL